MRGCRGGDPGRSVEEYRISQRRTNSGEFATDWRARGEESGRVMRLLFAEGKCKGCPKLCVTRGCVADPDNFRKSCPNAIEFYNRKK